MIRVFLQLSQITLLKALMIFNLFIFQFGHSSGVLMHLGAKHNYIMEFAPPDVLEQLNQLGVNWICTITKKVSNFLYRRFKNGADKLGLLEFSEEVREKVVIIYLSIK